MQHLVCILLNCGVLVEVFGVVVVHLVEKALRKDVLRLLSAYALLTWEL